MGAFNVNESIKGHISCFEQKIKDYPHYSEIEKQMKQAQEEIGYKFQNISFLKFAFCRTKLQDGNKNYMNDTLAQVGDAVLDTIISERYFAERKSKKDIDDFRKKLANNNRLFSITQDKKLTSFCYHERCFHDNALGNYQVSARKHDAIVEAIIGAIYLDGGLDKAREWIYENIMKDLEKTD